MKARLQHAELTSKHYTCSLKLMISFLAANVKRYHNRDTLTLPMEKKYWEWKGQKILIPWVGKAFFLHLSLSYYVWLKFFLLSNLSYHLWLKTFCSLSPELSFMTVNLLKIWFLNYSLHSILFCISVRHMAQWLDSHVLYKMFPPTFPVSTWHHT